MSNMASCLLAALASVPAFLIGPPVLDAGVEVPVVAFAESCLTGATQCKATIEVTGGCGVQVQTAPGDVKESGTCKCDPTCKPSTQCKLGCSIEVRVTTPGTILLISGQCFATNAWGLIGNVGKPANPLKLDCGQDAANFFGTCYNGTCGGVGNTFVSGIVVTAKCTKCNGDC